MLDFFSGVAQMMPMAWMQIRGISAPPALTLEELGPSVDQLLGR